MTGKPQCELRDPEGIAAWVAAAVADGWKIKPLYNNYTTAEAAILEREGWVVQMYRRPMERPVLYAWAPDKLSIIIPPVYSWDALQAALRHCQDCGAVDVTTRRVSFAGRVCEACLPEAQRLAEPPGWAN